MTANAILNRINSSNRIGQRVRKFNDYNMPIYGTIIKEYKNYYLAQMKSGYKECFLKCEIKNYLVGGK